MCYRKYRNIPFMKTSLDLPDDLYRRVKSKSALEGRAVREVATALFTAWVDGQVTAAESEEPVTEPGTDAPTSREEWLIRWRALATSVTQATVGTDGLVDQLRRDRG